MAVAPPTPTTPENETNGVKSRMHDSYLWHRLHSASGIFPIGFFVLQHLIANSYALRGESYYNGVIAVYGGLPFVAVLEIVLIYLPILYHSIYGFWITAYGQPNMGKYEYGRNWNYFMQRVSGVIAFFYIGYHVWNTSLHKYILIWNHAPHPDQVINYASMAQQMADPTHYIIQAIGIIFTVFHFTNGLWNFCIRWGITISAYAQRMNQYVCWGLFVIFTGMGLWTIVSLHNAGVNHNYTPTAIVSTLQQ